MAFWLLLGVLVVVVARGEIHHSRLPLGAQRHAHYPFYIWSVTILALILPLTADAPWWMSILLFPLAWVFTEAQIKRRRRMDEPQPFINRPVEFRDPHP